MSAYRQLISSAILLCSFLTGFANEITLVGTYQGKNLYVQNPFTGNLQEFCTLEVFVNNTRANVNLNSSAFEIDLSFLQLNEEVHVRIVHKDGCKPKVLNSSVIKTNSQFHFLTFTIDEKSLAWSTKGEKQQGKFYVEHFIHNTWHKVAELDSKGGLATQHYQVIASHHSGRNKYRIRFKEANGHYFYSKVMEHTSEKAPITFTPKKVVNFINLSHHAQYEILDENGTSLMKGAGLHISVADLKPGNYFINIDNRTEKFTKH